MKLIIPITFSVIIAMTAGCGMIDFRNKSIATEQKVIGIDATVPSITSGEALCSVRIGYISNKYISAPKGSTASIKDNYKNWSFLSLSGDASSELIVTNDTERTK